MKLIVISTAFNAPTEERCRLSVWQQNKSAQHIYINAALQNPVLSSLQNTSNVIDKLNKEDIVCLVDGDDWLHTKFALDRIYEEHLHGAWLTYGSYINENGTMGFAQKVIGPPRQAPWTATHLKTFRAGLFQRIKKEDLDIPHAGDLAMMFPMLEMAGDKRSVYIPDILYMHYRPNSFWDNNPNKRNLVKQCERKIRGLKEYERIEVL